MEELRNKETKIYIIQKESSKMAKSSSVITLNVNELNIPIKRQRLAE